MHEPILEVAIELVATFEGHAALAVHGVEQPVALVHDLVGPLHRAWTGQMRVDKGSDVAVAFLRHHFALSGQQPGYHRACEQGALLVHFAHPRHLAVHPIPVVRKPLPHQLALAVLLVVEPVPLVDAAVGVHHFALALRAVVNPAARVHVAVFLGEDAVSPALVLHPLSVIHAAIGVVEDAQAVILAILYLSKVVRALAHLHGNVGGHHCSSVKIWLRSRN